MRKEVKTGILVIVAIALFVFGFNFLKGRSIFKTQRTFYAIYNNIDGLTTSNPVFVNGMSVGHVTKIELLPGKTGDIMVTFTVDHQELQIPVKSTAKIASMDLLGSKSIEIILGHADEFYQSGDTLRSSVQVSLTEEVNRQVAPLKLKAESLISSVDSVMTIVQTVLNKETISNLASSFESLNKTMSSLEKTAYRLDTVVGEEKSRINSIMANMESITNNFRDNNAQLSRIITNMGSITDSLAKANIASTINNADLALAQAKNILDKINRGEGSMGMLINNNELYKNLEKSSAEMEKLIIDMRSNPHRYLHFSLIGGKNKANKE
ncbi:MAG: MCE family protein [Bacteroidetes bacterium]|nr:MCE family protein [Bacteroidota bacterium]HET6244511.1 MlaD family protein [Bacteroidia bacterium]